MAMFAGQEWFEAFGREIEASETYREAAADWEGDIAFRVVAEPDRNVPEDLWGYLDLWHGRCRRGEPSESRNILPSGSSVTTGRWLSAPSSSS